MSRRRRGTRDEVHGRIAATRRYAELLAQITTKSWTIMVFARSAIGTNRIIDMLSGEQLPRIC